MKQRAVYIGSITFLYLLLSTYCFASSFHAPHDDGNGVTCALCHTESLQPLSMLERNVICTGCHDNASPPLPSPQVKTHSATVIHAGDPLPWPHGDWGEKGCLECHDPHFQEQLTNYTVTSFYLTTGTINSLNTTSSFSYTLTSTPVPGWDPATNGAKWNAKSSSGRGLILVITDNSPTPAPLNTTFEITSVNATEIVVNGDLTGLAGSNFGVIYGMLVKSAVNGQPVVFTGPSTFVDTDGVPPVEGVCQVCHDDTVHPIAYWPADGTISTDHSATDCTNCHTHQEGFKGVQVHDVTYDQTTDLSQLAAQGCQDCHGSVVSPGVFSLATWDDIFFEHGNNCDTCHAYVDDGQGTPDQTVVENTIANGTTVKCLTCHIPKTAPAEHGADHFGDGLVTFTTNNTCEVCHTSDVISGLETHNSNCALCHTNPSGGDYTLKAGSSAEGHGHLDPGFGNPNTCATCHTSIATNYQSHQNAFDHTGQVSAHPDCGACHAHQGDPIAVVHMDNCGSCHTPITGVLRNSATGIQGPADCMDCHGDFFNHPPSAVDHSTLVMATDTCVTCHDEADLITGVHAPDTCNNCHTTTGALIPPAVTGGGECATCHTSINANYQNHMNAFNHTGQVTAHPDCATCHDGDPVPIEHMDNCGSCHTPITGVLRNSATAGAGDCKNCHGEYFDLHTYGLAHLRVMFNPSSDLSQEAPGTPCNICHNDTGGALTQWSDISTEHNVATNGNGPCATCHSSSRGEVTTAIDNGQNGNTQNCINCHSDKETPATHGANHLGDGFVTYTTNNTCETCHTGGVISGLDTHKGNCTFCHNNPSGGDYSLIGKAAGHRVPEDGPLNTCSTCHGALFTDIHPTTVNHASEVSGLASCTGCHDATAGTATGIPLSTTDSMVHDACTTCHANDGRGTLQGSASGNSDPNNCGDCHTLYATNFAAGHQNEDHGNVVGVTPCTDCHTGNMITSARIHEDNCENCHVNSASDGTLTDSAAGHTIGSPSNCRDCHGLSFAHDTNSDHDNRPISWTLGNTAACDGCHSSDNDTIGSPGTGSLTTQAHVDALHDKNGDGTLMANQCELCHWYIQAWANPEGQPIATAIANYIANGKGAGGTPVECTDCHSYNINDHGGHAPDDFTWTTSCSASNCHNQAGNSDIVQSPNVHNSDCALCHVNPTGGDWTRRSLAVGQTRAASCADCHGFSTFGGHPEVDHSTVVMPHSNCTNCHDATAGTPTGIPTNPGDNKVHDSCSTCHNADGSLGGGGGGNLDIIEDFTGAGDEATPSFANSWSQGGDGPQTSCFFTDQNTTSSSGTGLTAGNPAPYVYLEASTGGTPTCGNYTSGDAWWLESPDIDGSAYTALDLSFDWNYESNAASGNERSIDIYYRKGSGGSWTWFQNIQDGALGTTSPWQSTGNIDLSGVLDQAGSRVRIQITSTTTDYAQDIAFDNIRLVGSGSGGGSIGPGDCTTCHFPDFSSHPAVGHATRVGPTANCTGCHDQTAGTATGIPLSTTDNKIHDDCTSCHDGSGNLIGAAIGHTDPNDCAECHFPTFAGHPEVDHSAAVSLVSACSACHDGAQGTVTGIPTDTGNDMIHDDCNQCHSATDGLLIDIAAGNPSPNDCTDCHGPDSAAAHHGGNQATTGNCGWCHADRRPWNNAPTEAACRECHLDGNGRVITNAPAPDHTFNTSGAIQDYGACFDCHTVYPFHGKPLSLPTYRRCTSPDAVGKGIFNLFYNEFNMDGSESDENGPCENYNPPNPINFWDATMDLGALGSQTVPHFDGSNTTMPTPSHNNIQAGGNCGTCHTVTNIITMTHKNNCFNCHFSDRQDVQDFITAGMGGATVTCSDCHGTVTHDPPTDHDMVSAASGCATSICHNNASSWNDIETLHLNDCQMCHTSTRSEVVNAIANGKSSNPNPVPVDCQTCHGSGSGAAHHGRPEAKAGDCTWCHEDPRSTWDTMQPGDNGSSEPRPTQLACAECHIRVSGSSGNYTLNIDRLVYNGDYSRPPSTTAVHTFTGMTNNYIYNYGMCMSCHANGSANGSATTYHAKPSASNLPTNNGRCNEASDAPGRGTFNRFYNEFNRDGSEDDQSCENEGGRYQNPASGYGYIINIPCISENGCSGSSTIGVPVLAAKPDPGGGGGSCSGTLSILNNWSQVYNGTASSPSASYSISSGSNRLLLVAVTNENGNSTTNSWTVRYGSQTLTQIDSANGGRANMWMGYLNESDISNRSGNTLSVTMSGSKTYTRMHAISFENADQVSPITDFDSDTSGSSSVSSINLQSSITVGNNDRMVYTATNNSQSTSHSPSSGYTERVQSTGSGMSTSAGYRSSTSSGSANPTISFGTSSRSSIIGATVDSCN